MLSRIAYFPTGSSVTGIPKRHVRVQSKNDHNYDTTVVGDTEMGRAERLLSIGQLPPTYYTKKEKKRESYEKQLKLKTCTFKTTWPQNSASCCPPPHPGRRWL